ncbi:MAG: hypothetical protein AB1696_28475 [Planctomycetota bacterium]
MESRLEKFERLALRVVLILIVVALQIALQTRLRLAPQYLLPFVSTDGMAGGSMWAAAMLLGFLFGLIGCPICGVPLAACVSLRSQSVRHALLTTGLFNLGRLVSFCAVGVLAWLGVRGVTACAGGMGAMAAFCAVGFLMMVLGIELFVAKPRLACEHPQTEFGGGTPRRRGEEPGWFSVMGFLLWGLGVGTACGAEALAFVLPIWAATATLGLGGALLMLLVFCLTAFVPITLFVVAASCSIGALRGALSPGVFKGVKYAGGVFVMLMGTQFLCAGIRGLVQL